MPLHTRPASPADYPDFARLFRELGVDDKTPDRATWATHQAPGTLFHELEGKVVAYTYFQVLHALAYVRHVVVDPAARGQGRGYEVMRALASHLRALGCRRWCLNVAPSNEPALRLYRGLGMRTAYRSTALRFDWDLLARLPEAYKMSLGTCLIDPVDDAAIEAAFALPDGQLADLRARPGQLLLRLDDPDHALGFAAFDPQFPGAFPFRVARPALAGPLLRALQQHALPDSFMQLVIEDDEPLSARLLAAGARLRLELLHLRGELP